MRLEIFSPLLLKSTFLGGGVARRGGLQRVSEASPMEVRSDRTPQPARERTLLVLSCPGMKKEV